MRCDRCGYSSPENHRFCGMCGLKLGRSASSVLIDDNDPLEIETSHSDDRSASTREPIQFRERERRRESARDTAQSSNGSRGTTSSAAIENLPPDTAQEEAAKDARSRRSTNRSGGISGPSFLGLNEDSNNAFIYDKPDDGFVYDTATETPEYLLTEVSRGVSWRAWAFFLLLIVGGGLGYIQWRASHNQGPDIASILAGNGATVDPSGPDMTKPASLKPPTPPPDATNAAKNGVDQAASSEGDSAKASSNSESSVASKDSTESTKTGDTTGKGAAGKDDSKDESAAAKSPKASASTADKDSEESAKPESDGPVAKATKSKRAQPAPVEDEEAPQPKSLGEKDPLIVQANKYLHARGARKNCSAAVNLLRQASSAGNPSADVKMGALYWSGTCVTQSNVTAYQWFARAHSLEPNNRWVERSRSSLWARLTPTERRRVGY
jgi:hypothetical protein